MSAPREHQLLFYSHETVEFAATATPEGHIELGHRFGPVEIHETWVECSACGPLSTDELAAHGLSEYWEQT